MSESAGTHRPFESYSRLEEVANFFLNEAFRYAYLAAEYEVAGIILGGLIESIDVEPEWKVPDLPESLPEILKSESSL